MAQPSEPMDPRRRPPTVPFGRRPPTVPAAVLLMYVAAAALIAVSVLTFVYLSTYQRALKTAYAGTELAGTEDAGVAFNVVVGALDLIVGVALVVVAVLVARGRRAARITSWVLLGLLALCGLCTAASSAAQSALTGSADTGGVDMKEVARKLSDALPGWYQPVMLGLMVVATLAAIGGIILLALPASHRYFQRPAAQLDPPVPGATYVLGPQEPPAGPPESSAGSPPESSAGSPPERSPGSPQEGSAGSAPERESPG